MMNLVSHIMKVNDSRGNGRVIIYNDYSNYDAQIELKAIILIVVTT